MTAAIIRRPLPWALRVTAALAAAVAVTAAVDAGPGPVAATASPDTPPGTSTRVPPTFVLTGGGWGHGVGMSQYGAQAQALAGRSAAQILRYYYTGTALTSVADSSDIRVQVLGGVPSAAVTVRALDELGGRFLVTRGRRSLRGRAGDELSLRVTGHSIDHGYRRDVRRWPHRVPEQHHARAEDDQAAAHPVGGR